MRRSRRGLSGGHEFGGSGEDSFVAVVVTKLTGALLFILLLTMVIMALVPKADEVAQRNRKSDGAEGAPPAPLTIRTPAALPEAIVGRPYSLALAADGGAGPLTWSVDGPLPEGLALDASTGVIAGTPKAGTPRPVDLTVRVKDGSARAASVAKLIVYQPDSPLTTPSAWAPKLPAIPWRSWMEQGFGFLVLLLVYLMGLNLVGGLERLSARSGAVRRLRFSLYRATLSVGGLGAGLALAIWLRRG